MKTRLKVSALITAAFACFPALAHAHHAEFMRDKPLLQGISMPIHGLDHMLVTIAVGMIAAQIGKRALWAIPCAFTVAVLLGGILNLMGIPMPLLEWGILASIVVFGGLLTVGSRASLALTAVVVALFAAMHGNALIANDGYVHNMPVFIVGCLISALLLQAAGVGLGLGLQKLSKLPVYRYAGFAMIAVAALIGIFPDLNNCIISLIEKGGH